MDYMDIELLKSLISDIVALYQNQNIPLDFKYKGNNSTARLLAIAPCEDSKNFLKKQKKDGGLEFKFIVISFFKYKYPFIQYVGITKIFLYMYETLIYLYLLNK